MISRLFDDGDLVANAQSGDPVAMDELLSALRPEVFRFCRSRLASYAGGVDSAEDVAQETCVAVFVVLPKYEQQGAPFASWVYAIAANKIADVQRKFSRAALLVDELPDQVEPSPSPEDEVMASTVLQVATDLVAGLPERMRQVLLLRAGGASAESVGNELGLSASAVRVMQHRASARLRKLVSQSEEHRELFAASLRNHPSDRPRSVRLSA